MRILLSFAVLFCLDVSFGWVSPVQAQPPRGRNVDPEESFRIQREQLIENVLIPGGVTKRVLESSVRRFVTNSFPNNITIRPTKTSPLPSGQSDDQQSLYRGPYDAGT